MCPRAFHMTMPDHLLLLTEKLWTLTMLLREAGLRQVKEPEPE
jgi:hypothetical protein